MSAGLGGGSGERTPAALAVVVCTHNRSASLCQTLASLYACGTVGAAPIDILVVANACTDDTLARLSDFAASHPHPLLSLSWLVEPRAGKSHALNAAIAHTRHAALCFIDDDQAVEAGFLARLQEGLARYPNDAIYCGRIWPAWDGSEPDWVHTTGDYAIPIRPFPEFDLGDASRLIPRGERLPSGGNITVRRAVFERVGLFSTELGPTGHNLVGGEDHDFLKRAVEQGLTLRYLAGVRQLHAVDAERLGTRYTLHKSFMRSRANILIRPEARRPRLYMLRKVFTHAVCVAFTFNRARRFHFAVRLAASLGELAGAVHKLRSGEARQARRLTALDPFDLALAGVALGGVVLAWHFSSDARWAGLIPVGLVAVLGSLALLAKSLADFSQTGPRVRGEVLRQYRGYGIYALARLTFWAFLVVGFIAGVGVLVFLMLVLALDWQWSVDGILMAALLGVLGAFALQFLRKLRHNPGLIVASMHYRSSRLYRLWEFATPRRIVLLDAMLGLGFAGLFAGSASKLLAAGEVDALIALSAANLSALAVLVWTIRIPRVRPKRRRTPRAADAPPNILMLGSDTLRADRLGAMGYRRALTPHLDALAQVATQFTNCYVPCARTAPSLVSLLTGTWPHHHGIRDNFVSDAETQIGVKGLPELLKRKGYFTAALSDWCGADMGKFPLGFDYCDLPEDQWSLKYLIRQGPKDLRLFLSLFMHNRLGRVVLPEIYYLGGVPLTSQLAPRARQLVARLGEGEQPFFLNVFYSTTHPPFASEWPWYARHTDPAYAGESKFVMARLTDPFEIIRRQGAPREEFDLDQIIDLYDGCVAQFDDEVGQMLAHLDACGLADNTLVVVYSDHGMEFFEHDTWGQGNSAVGEASPRVPLFIRDPRQPGGQRVDAVVRSIDIAPTLLASVGLTVPADMDGVSLAACLAPGNTCPELDAFNETGIWIADIPGLPDGHLRYPNLLELIEVADRASGTLSIKREYVETVLRAKDRMLRRGRWKLVYQPLETGYLLRLFDVHVDPQCRFPVEAMHPEICATLWAALRDYIDVPAVEAKSDHRPAGQGQKRQ